ncbi:hypothetical protein GSI_08677 [Ganoderma sinense ZZ0214-1]|uniref:DUF6534 domain-containing protein n=1 Tax=Ganoderma sinense ZZ0214-1 TaxID=1077348 RepID=A0A2G8S4G5_9APHY|nr:hypothetical protein GSI_08677 [Ganoderma sinense ZZ0214-1]
MSPAEELARVKEALGCIIVGLVVSSILYGITLLQAYIYYKQNTRDFIRVKILVGILVFLDTTATASITAGAFVFFVDDFGRQATLVNTPPTLALETGTNALIATTTQFFFAYRLWIFSGKNSVITGSIALCSILSLGPALWTATFFLDANSLFNLGLLRVRVVASLANGLGAICDILIASGLCWYLHLGRSGFKHSDTIIDRLMLYTIECGALTALCQTAILVTVRTDEAAGVLKPALTLVQFAALPGRIIFIPFQLVVGKLYCNALLATLNVRKHIRALNPMQDIGSEVYPIGPRSTATNTERRTSQTTQDAEIQTMSEIIIGAPSTSTGTESEVVPWQKMFKSAYREDNQS